MFDFAELPTSSSFNWEASCLEGSVFLRFWNGYIFKTMEKEQYVLNVLNKMSIAHESVNLKILQTHKLQIMMN